MDRDQFIFRGLIGLLMLLLWLTYVAFQRYYDGRARARLWPLLLLLPADIAVLALIAHVPAVD